MTRLRTVRVRPEAQPAEQPPATDDDYLRLELADALRELAKLRALIETLEEENRLLRAANATLGRPWATREGERE